METIIRSPAVALETRQLKRPGGKQESPPPPAASLSVAEAKTIPAVTQPTNPATIEKDAPSGMDDRNARLLVERELANARQQIEQELADARVQLEQEAVAIRAAAEREGFAKGMDMAEQAARQAVAEQTERLESIMAALSQARAGMLDGAEDAMVEIVFAAVCRIIGEMATTRIAVSGMVDQVLAAFKERDKLIVRVHPQDYELLQQVQEVPDGREAVLRADASIKMGGGVVESGTGFLDARIETQLARLGEALLAARRKREQLGEAL
ncbi:MAG TPA: FliH/SctL family protein [Noviherbaspirillum sp.]|nr:FliH/SctL family protein [Noviherbaspirillum sp.]